jgi:hypothetical protein
MVAQILRGETQEKRRRAQVLMGGIADRAGQRANDPMKRGVLHGGLTNPPLTTLEASRRKVALSATTLSVERASAYEPVNARLSLRQRAGWRSSTSTRASHAVSLRPLSVVARFAHLPTRGFERR